GIRFTKGMAKQCVDMLEQHVRWDTAAGPEPAQSPLGRLAKIVERADAAPLVSALLYAGAPPPGDGGNGSPEWSEADEALGRALQDMDFLDRSFAKLESGAEGELADRAGRAKDASDLILQWVRQAARLGHRDSSPISGGSMSLLKAKRNTAWIGCIDSEPR